MRGKSPHANTGRTSYSPVARRIRRSPVVGVAIQKTGQSLATDFTLAARASGGSKGDEATLAQNAVLYTGSLLVSKSRAGRPLDARDARVPALVGR